MRPQAPFARGSGECPNIVRTEYLTVYLDQGLTLLKIGKEGRVPLPTSLCPEGWLSQKCLPI